MIILWTANTERFADVSPGLNTTADEILDSIARGEDEVAPSQVFAVASILEGCAYINGSPRNTFVPGIIDLAERHEVCAFALFPVVSTVHSRRQHREKP